MFVLERRKSMLFNLGTWISRICDEIMPEDVGSEESGAYLLRADGSSFLLLCDETARIVRA